MTAEDGLTHGRNTTYNHHRFRRTRENGGIAPVPAHGDSTYKNWGCGCGTCVDAHSAAMRAYKARVAS